MKGNETILLDKDGQPGDLTAADGDKQRSFAFDHSFWSCSPQDPGFASGLRGCFLCWFFCFCRFGEMTLRSCTSKVRSSCTAPLAQAS
jgi:hypothetical protein